MIYLDNSATTKIDKRVVDVMLPYLKEEYGNPSSKYYTLALKSKKAVEKARCHVAALINAKPEEIVFTSGATESNNLIIKGVADYMKYYEKKGNHIITSKVEHKATLNTCKFLNGEIYSNKDATFSLNELSRKVDRGFKVSFLDVNEYGQVDEKVFTDSITNETTFASIIWGNNEIGTLNNIKELCKIAHDKNVLFHTDATQVIGKMKVDVKELGVDFLSLSAHKFSGPKGIGALYLKSDDYGLPPITSLIHGGNQEFGIRAGTLAVHNIVGLGKAAEIALKNIDKKKEKLMKLHEYFLAKVDANDILNVIGSRTSYIPGIINCVVKSKMFNNEQYIKKISDKFAISTGSACTAGEPSHVIEAIGKSNYMGSIIRISLSEENTYEHLDSFIKELGCDVDES